jgi:predicted nucleic acid-binding protein
MNDKHFIDTHIFIYSFDNNQPEKKSRSEEIIRAALQTGSGIISTQVVQEFLNVATQKFTVNIKSKDARLFLRFVLNPLCQVYPDFEMYDNCLEIRSETGYSFYDSLILTAAIKAGCKILYSEDFQDGQDIRGVKIVNPYRSS